MAQIWHTPTPSDIEAQKHWELNGVERGVERVRASLDSQSVADSQLGSALAQRAVPRLIEKIEEAQAAAEEGLVACAGGKGRPTPWWYIILMLPADKLAVIVTKRVMSAPPREFTFSAALTSLATSIHRSILDQLDYEDWGIVPPSP